jgi:hypothetical protein
LAERVPPPLNSDLQLTMLRVAATFEFGDCRNDDVASWLSLAACQWLGYGTEALEKVPTSETNCLL